jgi:hypothetical protein
VAAPEEVSKTVRDAGLPHLPFDHPLRTDETNERGLSTHSGQQKARKSARLTGLAVAGACYARWKPRNHFGL